MVDLGALPELKNCKHCGSQPIIWDAGERVLISCISKACEEKKFRQKAREKVREWNEGNRTDRA